MRLIVHIKSMIIPSNKEDICRSWYRSDRQNALLDKKVTHERSGQISENLLDCKVKYSISFTYWIHSPSNSSRTKMGGLNTRKSFATLAYPPTNRSLTAVFFDVVLTSLMNSEFGQSYGTSSPRVEGERRGKGSLRAFYIYTYIYIHIHIKSLWFEYS